MQNRDHVCNSATEPQHKKEVELLERAHSKPSCGLMIL